MATVNTYDINDAVKLTGTFKDSNDVLVDPDIVICKVKFPDATFESYTFGLGAQGAWNASTNTPALADGSGTKGNYYTVSVAGTVDFGNGNRTFTTDDWVYYDGERYRRLDNAQSTAVTQDSTGVYSIIVKMRVCGNHYYRYEGEGDQDAGGENRFHILDSKFYPVS